MSLTLLDAPVPDITVSMPAPQVRALAPASMPAHEITRDFTYARSTRVPLVRGFIRAVETATGRNHLIRRASGYEAEVANGADFWRVMMDRFAIRLDVHSGSLGMIPACGPLIAVANHPFGILDGLVMGHILSGMRRRDFRIIAHSAFEQCEDVRKVVLPIDFSGTREAQQTNLRTRARAIGYLARGGAVGIFPGGTVSTAPTPLGTPMDPQWRGFTARMVTKSAATVVPIWFDGANSRLFQMASHLCYPLRMALLVREFRKRVNTPVRLAIGAPLGPEVLSRYAGDAKQMMDFLRRKTYELSPEPLNTGLLGHEFEEQYKR